MRNKHKINAFTLTEVLVVIVISALVVGMALSVLNLVQQNFYSIRENFQNTTDQQLLQQQVAVDFNRYHYIRVNSSGDGIIMKNPIDSIAYNFRENLMIRNLDTMPTKVPEVLFFYKGKKVLLGKIDAIKLSSGKENTGYIFISKYNDAKNSFEK